MLKKIFIITVIHYKRVILYIVFKKFFSYNVIYHLTNIIQYNKIFLI